MDIKLFLNAKFLKFIFFSLNGRISRRAWWYSQAFIVLVGIVVLFLGTGIATSIGLDKSSSERLISFLIILISAIGIFPDAKRLQDRTINGLLALFPYVLSIPLQFHFVPEFLMKFYIFAMWGLKAYIFVNTGVLGSHKGSNKYGQTEVFDSDSFKDKKD